MQNNVQFKIMNNRQLYLLLFNSWLRINLFYESHKISVCMVRLTISAACRRNIKLKIIFGMETTGIENVSIVLAPP